MTHEFGFRCYPICSLDKHWLHTRGAPGTALGAGAAVTELTPTITHSVWPSRRTPASKAHWTGEGNLNWAALSRTRGNQDSKRHAFHIIPVSTECQCHKGICDYQLISSQRSPSSHGLLVSRVINHALKWSCLFMCLVITFFPLESKPHDVRDLICKATKISGSREIHFSGHPPPPSRLPQPEGTETDEKC